MIVEYRLGRKRPLRVVLNYARPLYPACPQVATPTISEEVAFLSDENSRYYIEPIKIVSHFSIKGSDIRISIRAGMLLSFWTCLVQFDTHSTHFVDRLIGSTGGSLEVIVFKFELDK